MNMSCTYTKLCSSVKEGDVMLVADGGLSLKVEQVQEEGVLATALNSFSLGTRKNMNLPNCFVDLPILSEKDKDDLVNFGIKHKVDMVAASFVQRAEDIRTIRSIVGSEIKIIAKIENNEGLKN